MHHIIISLNGKLSKEGEDMLPKFVHALAAGAIGERGARGVSSLTIRGDDNNPHARAALTMGIGESTLWGALHKTLEMLPEAMKIHRDELGVSVREMAKIAGVHYQTWYRTEERLITPSFDTLLRILKYLSKPAVKK